MVGKLSRHPTSAITIWIFYKSIAQLTLKEFVELSLGDLVIAVLICDLLELLNVFLSWLSTDCHLLEAAPEDFLNFGRIQSVAFVLIILGEDGIDCFFELFFRDLSHIFDGYFNDGILLVAKVYKDYLYLGEGEIN